MTLYISTLNTDSPITISSGVSRNSEAEASEFLENREEMFPL